MSSGSLVRLGREPNTGGGSVGQAGVAQSTQDQWVLGSPPQVWDTASAWQAWVCGCAGNASSQIGDHLRSRHQQFALLDKNCPP